MAIEQSDEMEREALFEMLKNDPVVLERLKQRTFEALALVSRPPTAPPGDTRTPEERAEAIERFLNGDDRG